MKSSPVEKELAINREHMSSTSSKAKCIKTWKEHEIACTSNLSRSKLEILVIIRVQVSNSWCTGYFRTRDHKSIRGPGSVALRAQFIEGTEGSLLERTIQLLCKREHVPQIKELQEPFSSRRQSKTGSSPTSFRK